MDYGTYLLRLLRLTATNLHWKSNLVWTTTKSVRRTLHLGNTSASGRELTRADDENAALVAIRESDHGARYWRDQDPIDRRLQVKGPLGASHRCSRRLKYEHARESKAIFLCAACCGFVRDRTCISAQPNLFRAFRPPAPRGARMDGNLAYYERLRLSENRLTAQPRRKSWP